MKKEKRQKDTKEKKRWKKQENRQKDTKEK